MSLHLFLCCSVDHGSWAFHSRGAVTGIVHWGIAQHCSRSSEKDFYFAWLLNQFTPSRFHYKLFCYESELQRSPYWCHCIDHCILILHVFWRSFLLLIYISFLAAVFSPYFSIVGSGISPLEDDEDAYARSRYKGECFAYVPIRISWLLGESFLLFS